MKELDAEKQRIDEQWLQARKVFRSANPEDWHKVRCVLMADDPERAFALISGNSNSSDLIRRFALLAMDQAAYDAS